MEQRIKELSKEEIVQMISELEHAYAELLADRSDHSTLNKIWKEIQRLRVELAARSN